MLLVATSGTAWTYLSHGLVDSLHLAKASQKMAVQMKKWPIISHITISV